MTTTTAASMIAGAFSALHVYVPGEDVLQADMAQGMAKLNQMIDSWSNESLTTYAILEQSVPLLPGVNQYTIGPGGMINATRPIRVLHGPGAAYILDQNNNRYQVNVVERDQWNLLWNLLSVTSNLPDTMFYDPQFPLGVINVYPMPNQGNIILFWDSYLQLTQFVTPQQALSLPPGFEPALETNLALMLAPYYPSAEVTPALVDQARITKANVKRSNHREMIAVYDWPIQGNVRPYNIYSDSWR